MRNSQDKNKENTYDNEYKKEQCKKFKISSSSLETKANIAGLISDASGSYQFFGIPVGSVGASFFAGASSTAYISKLGIDISYIENECDDIPFEELKEILNDRFTHVNENLYGNYIAISKNLFAIRENYHSIKRIEDKIDKNIIAMQNGFDQLTNEFSKTKDEIKKRFEEIKALTRKSKIEEVSSKLITFIEYFLFEKHVLQYFSEAELSAKIQEENGILIHLKKSVTPDSTTSLPIFLNKIINQRFAFPENAQDKTAFIALYLLCLGTETYISILHFLLYGYGYLANNHYQKNELDKYNWYFFLSLSTLKDFINSLNGVHGRDGLIDQVLNTLNNIKELNFIKNEKHHIIEFISKKMDSFNQIKLYLISINNVFNTQKNEQIRYKFNHSEIAAPLLKWENGKKVSYAIQFMIKDKGVFFQVGDWSIPYTIYGKACPMLDIGIAPQGITRFIFRKFDLDKPELVGIVKDSTQIEFRDIHRDFYNSALEPNTDIALLNINRLIHFGANVTVPFEKGRQAIHAAAKVGNIEVVLALLRMGADINAQDDRGYTPLHIAAELAYESFIEELIDAGAHINVTSHLNWTALHVASEKGHINTIKNLLKVERIEVNARAIGGFTPLHMIVSSNQNDAIALLASDERVNVNAQSKERLTPLHLAVLGGYEQAVVILLNNHKIKVNLERLQGNLTALHLAVITGNKRIIRRLLEHHQIDINAHSEEGWTPLHLAILLKKEEVISELLSTNEINVNASGSNELTPLHLAAATGQKPLLFVLINHGAKLEPRDIYDDTPLHIAAKIGYLEIVRFLFEQGANIYAKNKKNQLPIDEAACMGHLDIVKYLIGKDGNFKKDTLYWAVYGGQLTVLEYLIEEKKVSFVGTDSHSEILLIVAAQNGHLAIVEKLLVHGAQVDVKDSSNGKTPLHWAAQGGHLEIVERLLVHGAQVDVKDNHGSTPLHIATYNGHLAIVEKLIEKDAQVNDRNKHGEMSLHLAAHKGYLMIVEKLIESGAEVDAKDHFDRTSLYIAAQKGHLLVVKKLIEEGAQISADDKYQRTPLNLAAENGHLAVVEALIENGAQVNVQDSFGRTPLHWAAENGHAGVVEKLIENGANVDIKDISSDKTPLHWAAQNGHLAVIEKLIAHGAQVDIEDKYGRTPLDLAEDNSQLEIVNHLSQLSVKKRNPSTETNAVLQSDYKIEKKRFRRSVITEENFSLNSDQQKTSLNQTLFGKEKQVSPKIFSEYNFSFNQNFFFFRWTLGYFLNRRGAIQRINQIDKFKNPEVQFKHSWKKIKKSIIMAADRYNDESIKTIIINDKLNKEESLAEHSKVF